MNVDRHRGESLGRLAPLIPSRLRALLSREDFLPHLRAVSVGFWGELFGVALGEILPDSEEAHLTSLFVRTEWRRRGIAGSLVRELESWFREDGAKKMVSISDETQPNLPIVNHILDLQGWEPVRLNGFYASCSKPATIARLLAMPWITRHRFPRDVTLGAWEEIPPAELERMAQRKQEGDFAAEVSCTDFVGAIDPRISVPAFTTSGDDPANLRLVGWMTVSPETEGWRQYHTLFVEPEYRNTGLGLALLAETISRHDQADRGKPRVGGYWFMREYRKNMQRLFQRRLQPLVDRYFNRFIREKRLAP